MYLLLRALFKAMLTSKATPYNSLVDRDRNIMLFIGSRIYKLYEKCQGGIAECLLPGYPKRVRKVFKRGPKRVSTAVYIPDHRRRTYLFKGKKKL